MWSRDFSQLAQTTLERRGNPAAGINNNNEGIESMAMTPGELAAAHNLVHSSRFQPSSLLPLNVARLIDRLDRRGDSAFVDYFRTAERPHRPAAITVHLFADSQLTTDLAEAVESARCSAVQFKSWKATNLTGLVLFPNS
jgi:hypothetical protein